MNFSTLLKFFMILQISVHVKGSCLDDFIGDSYCDDENNNEGCNYDEGKIILNLVKLEFKEGQQLLLDFNSNLSLKRGLLFGRHQG